MTSACVSITFQVAIMLSQNRLEFCAILPCISQLSVIHLQQSYDDSEAFTVMAIL